MDRNLRRPVTEEQANERNAFIKAFLAKMSESMELNFLTVSKYIEEGEC
jgi:hypothetical protein